MKRMRYDAALHLADFLIWMNNYYLTMNNWVITNCRCEDKGLQWELLNSLLTVHPEQRYTCPDNKGKGQWDRSSHFDSTAQKTDKSHPQSCVLRLYHHLGIDILKP